MFEKPTFGLKNSIRVFDNGENSLAPKTKHVFFIQFFTHVADYFASIKCFSCVTRQGLPQSRHKKSRLFASPNTSLFNKVCLHVNELFLVFVQVFGFWTKIGLNSCIVKRTWFRPNIRWSGWRIESSFFIPLRLLEAIGATAVPKNRIEIWKSNVGITKTVIMGRYSRVTNPYFSGRDTNAIPLFCKNDVFRLDRVYLVEV